MILNGEGWSGRPDSNRRRLPFQGCLPTLLSGSESAQVVVGKEVTKEWFRTDWDDLGCFRFPDVPVLLPPSSARIRTGTNARHGSDPTREVFPGPRNASGPILFIRIIGALFIRIIRAWRFATSRTAMKHTAILSPRAAALERIKALVLDTLTSPESKRAYRQGLR